MLLGGLYDNDISPIPPFSPYFFDTNEVDIHFFQDHPHLQVAQHPLLSRDTSSETIAESEVDNNMEVFHTNNISKDGDNCSGVKDGSSGSNIQRNKKSSISTKKNSKKRPFTKDRHSKIVTAQGPRDRRMRLSLEVAREFFMVQDMLGFDKGSKTVKWLMVQSEGAIKELSAGVSQSNCTRSVKSVSSTSECEVVSGYDEMASDEYLQQVNISGENPSSGISKEKRTKKSRKAAVNPLAKESRKKARARARERTIEKMWSRSQQCPQVTPHGLRKPNPSNSLKLGENRLPDSQSQDLNSSSVDAVDQVEPRSSHSLDCQGSIQDIVDESFAITNKSNSSAIFDYHHNMDISQGIASNNNFPNYSPNWDIDSSGTASVINMTSSLSQNTADTALQHHLADIHFYMPWDSYRR